MKIEKVYNLSHPKGVPFVSVAIATHNKAKYLDRTLESIIECNKDCPFPYEIVVVDDKSNDDTFEVCRRHKVIYARLPESERRNPSVPRNVAFRLSRGKVIIHQSDEVLHCVYDSIEKLTKLTTDSNFVIATVKNVNPNTYEVIESYTGLDRQKPYFFLGSVTKANLDKCGGYDEDFVAPAYDDDKLAQDLMNVGAIPIWTESVLGYHLDHPKGDMADGADSAALFYGRKYYSEKGGSNVVY
jgi:glycosyltransferase involved in cell wall biosynthesis